MPPGRYAGTEYQPPSEEELAALEAELAAQEAVPAPSPGLGAGSAYSAPPPPPPAETGPPPASAASVPPPPSGGPNLDFLAPAGAMRDAAVASPVGQLVGGVMGTPLPFADQLDVPPPTAVGGYLGQGNPGRAAQVVGDVAGRDPVATALTLATLPLGGPLARGAFGIGRGLLAGGASRAGALNTLRNAAALAGVAAPLGITAWLTKDLNTDTGDPTTPATTTPSSIPAPATPARTVPASATAAFTSTTTPAGSTNITGSGSAASRPASSTPVSAAQTTQTAPASAPARSSSPPSPGATGLADAVEFDSDAPFTASDFQGQLGDLPELRNISPTMARTMANTANAKFRRRRGKRGFPFSLERGEFHNLIRSSVFAALREGRS